MDCNHLYSLIPMEKSSAAPFNQQSLPFFALVQVLLFHRFLTWVKSIHSFCARCWSSLGFQLDSAKSDYWDEDFGLCNHQSCCLFNENKDDDRIISREEVELVMGKLSLFCSPEGEELPQRFDSNELSQLFDHEEPSLEEVKEAFDVFDFNKDGFIDAMELQRVLRTLGLKQGFQLRNCTKMIKRFDDNGDGRIDFNEFVKFMETACF
ncbi:hypothetical protein Dsin_017350 [Dipteronia sinensis]|uniref:EF-hand domain-containing protein n=1 Tax=Dipteronia sinensis TaxID=43782 RepID=A0AAE0E6G1_9ROSI|nr:hypothetical protein Dsin_017350 [Dipteronia sinensis]